MATHSLARAAINFYTHTGAVGLTLPSCLLPGEAQSDAAGVFGAICFESPSAKNPAALSRFSYGEIWG